MRKDQLVQALVRLEKKQKSSARRSSAGAAKRSKKGAAAKKSAKPPVAKSSARTKPAGKAARNTSAKKSTSAKSGARSRPPVAKKASRPQRKSASPRASGKASVAKSSAKGNAKAKSRSGKRAKTKNPVALRKIQEGAARREKLKNLAFASEAARRLESVEKKGQSRRNGQAKVNGVHKNGPTKDRIVLLVRDSYWLQACWDITRQSVLRAQASMAEHWHSARPVLRLIEMEVGGSTSSAERVVRDTEIHGGVNNWYIDVHKPPQAFRVDIGYLAVDGRFHVLARSNTVTTPEPGGADAVDRNWADVAENYEKFYAMSGGYTNDKGDLQDVFEERLHRPMGASTGARFGAGAERMLHRDRNFQFDVDAEIIVFGTTRPDAHLTISGEPVKVRPDGTFAVRLALPDRRQVLPVTASSRDGVEERTIVLAIERNTKVMEAVMHDPNEQ
ncbi:MAG: DUF4912 domain-containing protein [Planctomycetes bacterium]|nr:DUF4912 domain-containing protein [Planctomycetota bacterium]